MQFWWGKTFTTFTLLPSLFMLLVRSHSDEQLRTKIIDFITFTHVSYRKNMKNQSDKVYQVIIHDIPSPSMTKKKQREDEASFETLSSEDLWFNKFLVFTQECILLLGNFDTIIVPKTKKKHGLLLRLFCEMIMNTRNWLTAVGLSKVKQKKQKGQ